MKPQHTAISVLIVGCLTMQSVAYFAGTRFYPFVNYPMYRRAYGPPVEARMYQMFAQLPDGRRIDVSPEYLGIKRFAWEDATVKRILAEPGGPLVEEHRAEALDRVTAAVQARNGAEPVALHFTIQTHRIVPEGIERDTAEQTVRLDGSSTEPNPALQTPAGEEAGND